MAKPAKITDVIHRIIVFIAYVLVSLMVVNTVLGVFCRFVLNNALYWSDELGRYMMIWVGFIGCYLAARDNCHVGVELVVDRFKPAARKAIRVFAHLVIIAFLAIILAKSGEQLGLLGIQRSSALEIPMAIPYSAVTFGILMMLVEYAAHLIRLVKAPATATGAAEPSRK